MAMSNNRSETGVGERDRLRPPRIGAQPSIPLDEVSIAMEGEREGLCDECGRVFASKIGLGVHRRRAHPISANEAINVDRVKARWSKEEDVLLAKEERKAMSDGVKFMNQYLHEVFPGRSLEAIKKRRQNPAYKGILANMLQEIPETIGQIPSMSELVQGETVSDHITPLRLALEECIGHVSRIKGPTERLVDIARYVLNGQNSDSAIYEWLKRMFPHAEMPKGPRPRREPERARNKKEKRRLDYRSVQKLYGRDKGAAARLVLNEQIDYVMPSSEEMISFWSNIFSDQRTHDRPVENVPLIEKEELMRLWSPITEDEILAAELDCESAAGPDGISVKEWQKVPTATRKLMYNVILLQGKLEEKLSMARTVFIPKGQGDLNPGQFRPLSITSVVVRQLHKILGKRFQKLHKFDERQRAFINCDGTIENLSILTTVIADAKVSKKEVHIATLDIKKAFDSVPHALVIDTIKKLGCPGPFIEYINRLYINAKTIFQYNGDETQVDIGRGVLQGDPISPLMFNAVMDRALRQIDPDVGYTINGRLFNCIAYADDIVLISSTKLGMQKILTQIYIALSSFGLELSAEKSCTLSLVPSGKQKKMKVVCNNGFSVGEETLKQLGVIDVWKYLGINFDGRGVTKDRTSLCGDLSRLDRAPLKPQQRLELLTSAVLSKHLHTLVLGRTTVSKLRGLDGQVRKCLRKWLSLPKDVPTSYFYVAVCRGGLGIPCLAEVVPAIKKSRLGKFLASGTNAAVAMGESRFVRDQLEWCNRALSHIGNDVTKELRLDYWSSMMESRYDTKYLIRSRDCKASTTWVRKYADEVTGRDYIRYNQIRAGCLPSRARMQRGRTGARSCRAGCMASETNYHVIQQCHRTHGGRIMRHDRLVGMLGECLGGARLSYGVIVEPKLRTESGLWKPDLLITKNLKTLVLDVQVVSGTHMKEDNIAKIRKYREVAGLQEQILRVCGSNEVDYGAVTLSYKGVFQKDSAEQLYKLGINERQMFMLVTSTLRGSWLNWVRFNKMNTVEFMSPRRR